MGDVVYTARPGHPPHNAHRRPLDALRALTAAFGALRRWWAAGRHYRPERRYMRGGQTRSARASAER